MEMSEITCENRHKLHLDIDELEDAIEMASCPLCGGVIQKIKPHTIRIGCPVCNWEDSASLDDAIYWIHEGCPNCEKIEEKKSKVFLIGSSRSNLSGMQVYRAVFRTDAAGLVRNGRTDYWEILIHFCHLNELLSILDQRKILANSTGYYRLPAVCLTETPLHSAKDVRKIHGEFGIAFKKGDIIRNGGMPALYIIESLIKKQENYHGFCDSIKPFVNLIRLESSSPIKKRYDYLHEREWRVAKNIEFNEISPISIVLPESLSTIIACPEDIEKLRRYLYEFGELTVESTKN